MSDYSQLKATLASVEKEVYRARKLFPDPDGLSIALLEEVGELVQALLDRSLSPDEHDKRISEEAIQVAAVAVRISEEFDPLIDEVLRKGRPRRFYRMSRSSTRITLPNMEVVMENVRCQNCGWPIDEIRGTVKLRTSGVVKSFSLDIEEVIGQLWGACGNPACKTGGMFLAPGDDRELLEDRLTPEIHFSD